MRTVLQIGVATAVLLASLGTARGGDAKSDLESIAKDLHALDSERVAFDRTGRRFGSFWPNLDAEQDRLVGILREKRYKPAELIGLLGHEDPKVRTLAASALYAMEDPTLLAPLAPLVDDEAETFPCVAMISLPFSREPPPPPSFEKQTVGRVTRLLLGRYMEHSGAYATSGRPFRQVVKDYFDARKDREWCGSWFQAWLDRAVQGSSPVPPDRIEKLKALRARIDRVPMPDRAFVLAWLRTSDGGCEALASEVEIVGLLREAGAEVLVKLLQRRIPTDDPDLQARPINNYPYKRMQMLILSNARTLLRREDIPALLACEAWENDYQTHRIADPTQTPWWRIAAADLDPSRATEVLSPLWTESWAAIPDWDHEGRAALALAWWRHCSSSDPATAAAWFHDPRQVVGPLSHSRDHFVRALDSMPREGARTLAKAIISHPRFEELDWGSLEVLCRVVNGWEPRPVVSEDELRKATHPLGHHADGDMTAAEAQYPKETQALRARLKEWRKALRAWGGR